MEGKKFIIISILFLIIGDSPLTFDYIFLVFMLLGLLQH